MAAPAWLASAAPAIAQGGLSIFGNVLSSINARNENRWARDWQEGMYNQQEANEWAKWHAQNQYMEGMWNKQNAYNESMWHKMNEYNSPMAQMQRFKEAGLNPALIYGQSNTAPAIATASFGKSSIGKGSVPGTSVPNLPDWSNMSNSLAAYFQFRESAARTNNLEVQNSVLQQEALKKAAETIGLGTHNAIAENQLSVLKATALDAAEANLKKTNLEMDMMLNRNEREAAMNASNIREAAHRIMNMRGQAINQALDAQLKQMDIELKSLGIQPTDNMIIRMLGRMLNSDVFFDKNNNYDLLAPFND